MASPTPGCDRCGSPMPDRRAGGNCPSCLFATVLALEPTEKDAEQPRHLGDFELMEEVGRGGAGVVYRARQIGVNRIVALKTLTGANLHRRDAYERFRIEAEAVGRLEHPHIVPLYEVGLQGDLHFLALRFFEHGSLAQALRRKKFSATESATLVATAARAIHFAHQHGVLHRDLKPSNILLDEQGQPHITDFGLAKLADSDSSLTLSTSILGTPAYMAPEQASGQAKHAGSPADIYALGAILYELLTGQPPFTGSTALEVLRRVVETEPPRPRSLVPTVDRDLESICLRCLEKDADRRYSSAAALANDLDRWCRHEPLSLRPISSAERLHKWIRRSPLAAALSGGIALAVLAGLATTTWQWRRAVDARHTSERAAYYAQIMATLTTKYEPAVRSDLRRVPVSLRGWEWGHQMLKCLPELFYTRTSNSVLEGVSIAGDDRHVAVWGNGQLRVFDLRTAEERSDLNLPTNGVRRALFSPTGAVLACQLETGQFTWQDLEDQRRGRDQLGFLPNARDFTFSPDSLEWAVIDEAGGIRRKSLRPGVTLRELEDPGIVLTRVGYSEDGSLILARATPGPSEVLIRWDRTTGRRVPTAAGQTNVLRTVWDESGQTFAQLLNENRVEVRDASTGHLISTWNEPDRTLREVALAGGRLLTLDTDGRVLLIDLAQGGLIAVLSNQAQQLVTGPRATIALTLDREFGYRAWDLVTGNSTGEFPLNPSPIARAALSASGTLTAGVIGASVYVWLSDRSRERTVGAPAGKILALAYSPDSARYASAHQDGQIRIWHARSHRPERVRTCSSNAVTTLAWSRDGQRLVAGDASGKVMILSADQLEPLDVWDTDLGSIRSISLDATSRWLAVAGSQSARWWELPGRRKQDELSFVSSPSAVAFEPEGPRLFITSADGTLTRLEVVSRQIQTIRSDGLFGPPQLACGPRTPEGQLIAIANPNRRIFLFDGETLQTRGQFNSFDLPIQDLEFSPDGTRLVGVGAAETEELEPNRLMLWDPWTGAQALTLGEPGLRLWAVSVSPDGRQLITGGSGGFVKVFDSLPWWFPSELRGTVHGHELVPETGFSRTYWLDRLDAIRSTPR